MAQISIKQQDIIYDFLIDQGVSYDELQIDLLDHISCMVEQKMDNGLDFRESLTLSTHEFGLSNFSELQEATFHLLNLKLNKMKKVIGTLGVISALSIIGAVLFKLNHWPFANLLLVIGLLMVSFIIFPFMAFFDYKKSSSTLDKLRTISGYVSGILLSIATLFKIMHWPGAGVTYSLGLIFLILLFLPIFTFKNYKTAENKLLALTKSLLILAGIAIFWGLLPTNRNSSVIESNIEQVQQSEL